jgi:hypothetical protein
VAILGAYRQTPAALVEVRTSVAMGIVADAVYRAHDLLWIPALP